MDLYKAFFQFTWDSSMMEKNCNVINHTCKDPYLSLISENQDWEKMNELVSAPNTNDAHGPSRSKT
jgi:hypothetical protein